MFGYYSAPSHFHQYHPSPSPYASSRPSYYSSTPRASCSQQYHRAPRHYQIADSDDDDEDSAATYYEYLDAARRQQERRELLEAQARRRAQEERAIQQARRAEAERRAEQIRQEREYRAYVERQLEARRQAHLRAQQQLQREQQEQEERQRKIRQQQHKWQSDEDDFARAIFGQLGWHPLAQHANERSASPSASVKPIVQLAPSSQEPAVKPLPQRTGRQQPRMTYMAAVTLIQSLAKEQISIRQRLRDLHRISDEFSSLKSAFVFPESLIFDLEKSTKDSPALAYTAQNLPLRAQEESLTRLLTKLDAVPSNGSERVKSERKALAKAIQAELDRLDAEKLEQWKKQNVGESDDVQSTVVSVVVKTAAQAEQEQEVRAAPAPERQKEIQEAVNASTEEIPNQEEDQVDTTMATEHTGTDETGSSGTPSEAIEPLVQMEIDQSAVTLPTAEGEVQHIEISGSLPVDTESPMEAQPPEKPSPSTEPSDGSIVEAIFDTTSLGGEPVSGNGDTVASDVTLSVPSASTAPQQEQSRAPSHPQTQQHTEIEPTSQSTSSVSATLLPATHGLGLLEILPVSAEDPRVEDEAGAESDSGSDTSFEML